MVFKELPVRIADTHQRTFLMWIKANYPYAVRRAGALLSLNTNPLRFGDPIPLTSFFDRYARIALRVDEVILQYVVEGNE